MLETQPYTHYHLDVPRRTEQSRQGYEQLPQPQRCPRVAVFARSETISTRLGCITGMWELQSMWIYRRVHPRA